MHVYMCMGRYTYTHTGYSQIDSVDFGGFWSWLWDNSNWGRPSRHFAWITHSLYKSQLSACHFSRPCCESKPGDYVDMLGGKVTEHAWASILLRAVIINVRNPEWCEVARVSAQFIACSFGVPWPLPAVPHLDVENRNIPLQFIFPGLVAYGTQMPGDRAGK